MACCGPWCLLGWCRVLSIMALQSREAVKRFRQLLLNIQKTCCASKGQFFCFAQLGFFVRVLNKDADNNQGGSEEMGGGKWEEIGRGKGDQTHWLPFLKWHKWRFYSDHYLCTLIEFNLFHQRCLSSNWEIGGPSSHIGQLWETLAIHQSHCQHTEPSGFEYNLLNLKETKKELLGLKELESVVSWKKSCQEFTRNWGMSVE